MLESWNTFLILQDKHLFLTKTAGQSMEENLIQIIQFSWYQLPNQMLLVFRDGRLNKPNTNRYKVNIASILDR